MDRSEFPFLGFGVGLRRPHYAHVLASRSGRSHRRHREHIRGRSGSGGGVDWFEIISENFMVEGGRPLEVLDAVRDRYPIAMHGVSLSIGSTDRLSRDYLSALAKLAHRVRPAWISDHLCWTGVGGRNLHDLLPLPFNDEAVAHVAARIRRVQDVIERRIAIENVSSYMTYRCSTMTEWQFLAAVAAEADCAILLDINNVFVSAFNHGFSAEEYIDSIPPERVAQFHLAGHSDRGAYLLDSHDAPICEEVWKLYRRAVLRFGSVSTLIEWDDKIPKFEALAAAANRARRIYEEIRNLTQGRSGNAADAERRRRVA